MSTKKITASQLLLNAAALIETKGWTQGVFAKNELHHAVSSEDPSACSFCAIGALRRAGHELGLPPLSVKDELKRPNAPHVFARNALRAALGNAATDVMEFENRPSTKQQDVINLMHSAAMYAALEGN